MHLTRVFLKEGDPVGLGPEVAVCLEMSGAVAEVAFDVDSVVFRVELDGVLEVMESFLKFEYGDCVQCRLTR